MKMSNRKSPIAAMLVALIAFVMATLDADVSNNVGLGVFIAMGILAFCVFRWKGYMGVLFLAVVISESAYGGDAVIGALSSFGVIAAIRMFGFLSRVGGPTTNASIPCGAMNKAVKNRRNEWEPESAVLCVAGTPMAYQTGHEIAVDIGGEVSFFE
jgi:hypothetical protein